MIENTVATITGLNTTAVLGFDLFPSMSYLYLNENFIGEFDDNGVFVPAEEFFGKVESTLDYNTKNFVFNLNVGLYKECIGTVTETTAASGTSYTIINTYSAVHNSIILEYSISSVFYRGYIGTNNVISGPHIITGMYTPATRTVMLEFDTALDGGSDLKINYQTCDSYKVTGSISSYSKTLAHVSIPGSFVIRYTTAGTQKSVVDIPAVDLLTGTFTGTHITGTIDYAAQTLVLNFSTNPDTGTEIEILYGELTGYLSDTFIGKTLSMSSGYIIEDYLPDSFNSKIQAIFKVMHKYFRGNTVENINLIRNLYNPDFTKTQDIQEILFDLFNYKLFDLSYFSDPVQRARIESNQFRNIISIYKNMYKKDIYDLVFFMYEVDATVYLLNTSDWTGYIRSSNIYRENEKFMDSGFFLDQGLVMDNGFRTPFLEIEWNLSKYYIVNTLGENLYTSDASTASFIGANALQPAMANFVPGTLTLKYTVGGVQYEAVDDGIGGLVGSEIVSSNIDYFNGDIEVVFTSPPSVGSLITLDYNNYALWFYDIDQSIKVQIDNIRNVLARIFYTVNSYSYGIGGTTGTTEYTDPTTLITVTTTPIWISNLLNYFNAKNLFFMGLISYTNLPLIEDTKNYFDTTYIQGFLDQIGYCRVTFADGTTDTQLVTYKEADDINFPGETVAVADGVTLSYTYTARNNPLRPQTTQLTHILGGTLNTADDSASTGTSVTTTIGVGDGTTKVFEFAIPDPYLRPTTFELDYTIGSTLYTANDIRSGNLFGPEIASVSLDYGSGNLRIEFSTAPDNSINLVLRYKHGLGSLVGTNITAGTINYYTGQVSVTFTAPPDISTGIAFSYYRSYRYVYVGLTTTWNTPKQVLKAVFLGYDQAAEYLIIEYPVIFVAADSKFSIICRVSQ